MGQNVFHSELKSRLISNRSEYHTERNMLLFIKYHNTTTNQKLNTYSKYVVEITLNHCEQWDNEPCILWRMNTTFYVIIGDILYCEQLHTRITLIKNTVVSGYKTVKCYKILRIRRLLWWCNQTMQLTFVELCITIRKYMWTMLSAK